VCEEGHSQAAQTHPAHESEGHENTDDRLLWTDRRMSRLISRSRRGLTLVSELEEASKEKETNHRTATHAEEHGAELEDGSRHGVAPTPRH
jgi:hypothetical protein